MKKLKQEIMRICLILIIQVLISFLFSNFLNTKWTLKDLICNYVFAIFWFSYIVCVIGIRIVKKTCNQNKHNFI